MRIDIEAELPAGPATLVVVAPTDVLDHPALPAPLTAALRRMRATSRPGEAGQASRLVADGSDLDVLLLGPEAGTPSTLRDALVGVGASGALGHHVALLGPWPAAHGERGEGMLSAAVEGVCLGSYRFDGYRSRSSPSPVARLTVVAGPTTEDDRTRLLSSVLGAARRCDATNWARELVDTPPQDTTPERLAEVIVERAAAVGARTLVHGPDDLAGMGFGGLLGVGRGSSNGPRLVELAWGDESRRPVVLCGKGVTFDAGGLSIKNDRTQAWMKADMAGAAAVAAAVVEAARSGLDVSVRAVLPLVENLPSGTAIRPGDVLRHPDGTTTEVTNTDAEGRLILADALAYGRTLSPEALVDVATLTSPLLDGDRWLLFSPDDALATSLLAAGEAALDPGWRLPLLASSSRRLASSVADQRNYDFDGAHVDTCTAAAYLSHFAQGVPWAHLDIVGPAFHRGGTPWPYGATGSPTRALVSFLADRSASTPTA